MTDRGIQTNRRRNRQTNRRRDRKTDRWTERITDKKTDRERYTNGQTNVDGQTDRQTEVYTRELVEHCPLGGRVLVEGVTEGAVHGTPLESCIVCNPFVKKHSSLKKYIK